MKHDNDRDVDLNGSGRNADDGGQESSGRHARLADEREKIDTSVFPEAARLLDKGNNKQGL